MIIMEESYEVSEPTSTPISSSSIPPARRVLNITTPKFAAGDQEERGNRLEAGSLPQQRLASIGSVLKPAL